MELQWPLILFTFFVCVSGGIFALQGLLCVLGKGKKMQLVSLIASLVTLAIGGVAVCTHREHWERIFNGFGHITSGITLEMIGAVVFVIALLLYFLMMRRSEEGIPPKWVGVVAMIVGLGMAFITGESYLMPALPSWDTFLLPLYYVCNVVFFGGLSGMIIAYFTKSYDAMNLSSKTGVVGGVLVAVVVIIYAIYITTSGDVYGSVEYYFDPTLPDVAMVDIASTINVVGGSLAPMFWIGVVIVGTICPVALIILKRGAVKKFAAGELEEGKTSFAACAICAYVMALAGGIFWRCILYVVAESIFPMF